MPIRAALLRTIFGASAGATVVGMARSVALLAHVAPIGVGAVDTGLAAVGGVGDTLVDVNAAFRLCHLPPRRTFGAVQFGRTRAALGARRVTLAAR